MVVLLFIEKDFYFAEEQVYGGKLILFLWTVPNGCLILVVLSESLKCNTTQQ